MNGLLNHAQKFVKRNAGTILTCAGGVGVVSTAVLAVKATPRAIELINKAKEEKQEELTNWDIVRIAGPAYIPTVITGTATLACIFGANMLSRRQQAALISAYALVDTKYKEYTFDKINKSEVLEIINISDSDDPDEVQDDFMDTHFRELERLSGHKWYRLCDRDDLVGSCESLELMRYIHLCMMPYREVTEKDYDTWAEIIRKLFIKKENAYEV